MKSQTAWCAVEALPSTERGHQRKSHEMWHKLCACQDCKGDPLENGAGHPARWLCSAFAERVVSVRVWYKLAGEKIT